MSRRVRVAVLAAASAALLAAPLWAPALGREIPWFGVRRVEISGTRLLAPHEVLAASGVKRGVSVWEDARGIEAALLAHPAVAGARVTRRLPHTLRVRIEEKRPVAYVEGAVLRPATAAGEVLPVDPTRAPVDLPIVRGAWSEQGDSLTARLLEETARLGSLDPGLISDVSEIRRQDDAVTVLVLSHRLAEIVLPVGLDAPRLVQLRAVLADLERRFPNAGAAVPNVDLRFGDQIVVRLPSSVGLS